MKDEEVLSAELRAEEAIKYYLDCANEYLKEKALTCILKCNFEWIEEKSTKKTKEE